MGYLKCSDHVFNFGECKAQDCGFSTLPYCVQHICRSLHCLQYRNGTNPFCDECRKSAHTHVHNLKLARPSEEWARKLQDLPTDSPAREKNLKKIRDSRSTPSGEKNHQDPPKKTQDLGKVDDSPFSEKNLKKLQGSLFISSGEKKPRDPPSETQDLGKADDLPSSEKTPLVVVGSSSEDEEDEATDISSSDDAESLNESVVSYPCADTLCPRMIEEGDFCRVHYAQCRSKKCKNRVRTYGSMCASHDRSSPIKKLKLEMTIECPVCGNPSTFRKEEANPVIFECPNPTCLTRN
jgi:hypothetical protein